MDNNKGVGQLSIDNFMCTQTVAFTNVYVTVMLGIITHDVAVALCQGQHSMMLNNETCLKIQISTGHYNKLRQPNISFVFQNSCLMKIPTIPAWIINIQEK